MHARRRRAAGLAALSLTAGTMLVQAPNAPGTAKEPRPASHFRLNANGIEGAGLIRIEGRLLKGSVTLREIAPRQVFSYRAGRRLQQEFPLLKARIADTFTKAQADQRFLLRTELGTLTAGLLGKSEADAVYAKKSNVVSGTGRVLTGQLQGSPTAPTLLLSLPGFGEVRAQGDTNGALISLETASTEPIAVASSERAGGTAVAGDPFELALTAGRAAVLQLSRPGATATLNVSIADGSVRFISAQALLSTP